MDTNIGEYENLDRTGLPRLVYVTGFFMSSIRGCTLFRVPYHPCPNSIKEIFARIGLIRSMPLKVHAIIMLMMM